MLDIIIVEDNKEIGTLLCDFLRKENYVVSLAENGEKALSLFERYGAKLIILDIMLPEEDGMTILNKLRMKADTANMPVIMLTAKGEEYDRIIGLDSGADDYVSKPFSVMELISRIKAVLRRSEGGNKESIEEYTAGPVNLNVTKHVVKVNNVEVKVTYKEFELLTMLMKHKERVFDRDEILEKIWGYDFDGENRTVDVHIRTLRCKLGDAGNIIETVRGVGYKIKGEQ